MKKIVITGKRNTEAILKPKKKIRSVVDISLNNELFDNKKQIQWLNQLYLEEDYSDIKFAKREVERKLKVIKIKT